MLHLKNITIILALSVSIAAPLDAFFIYLRHRKTIILSWLICLISLALFLLSIAVEQYLEIFQIDSNFSQLLIFQIEITASILCAYALPHFIQKVLGLDKSTLHKTLRWTLFVLALFSGGASWFFSSAHFLQLRLIGLLLITVLYCVLTWFIHRRDVANPIIRRSLIAFLLLTLLFIPLILFSIWKSGTILSLAHPIYLSCINIGCLIFSYTYLNQPAFMDGPRVTEHFIRSYDISRREAEVLRLLLEGTSNKDMAEALYVSIKTVEAHITNLYRKTGVRNRLQLLNLLQSNRKG